MKKTDRYSLSWNSEEERLQEEKLLQNLQDLGISIFEFLNFTSREVMEWRRRDVIPEFEVKGFNYACDVMGLENVKRFIRQKVIIVNSYSLDAHLTVTTGGNRFHCVHLKGENTFPYWDAIAMWYLKLRDNDKQAIDIGLREVRVEREALRRNERRAYEYPDIPIKINSRRFLVSKIPDEETAIILKKHYGGSIRKNKKSYSLSGQRYSYHKSRFENYEFYLRNFEEELTEGETQLLERFHNFFIRRRKRIEVDGVVDFGKVSRAVDCIRKQKMVNPVKIVEWRKGE